MFSKQILYIEKIIAFLQKSQTNVIYANFDTNLFWSVDNAREKLFSIDY